MSSGVRARGRASAPRAPQGRTLHAFERLYATRIVTFHQRDNIIHFKRASLYQHLYKRHRAPRRAAEAATAAPAAARPRVSAIPARGDPNHPWYAIELRGIHPEWLPHDMPLYLDRSWDEAMPLIASVLGLSPAERVPEADEAGGSNGASAAAPPGAQADGAAAGAGAPPPREGGRGTIAERARNAAARIVGGGGASSPTRRGRSSADDSTDVQNGAYARML